MTEQSNSPSIATDPRCTECGEPVRCPRGHASDVMDVGEPSAFGAKGKTAEEWARSTGALGHKLSHIKGLFTAAMEQARAEERERIGACVHWPCRSYTMKPSRCCRAHEAYEEPAKTRALATKPTKDPTNP